jgi:hypothetical protein
MRRRSPSALNDGTTFREFIRMQVAIFLIAINADNAGFYTLNLGVATLGFSVFSLLN